MITLTVENPFDVVTAGKAVNDRFQEDGSQIVTIRNAENALTDLQRHTYWMWITDIADSTGNEKDDTHDYYKERFLTRIFYRDDQGYREMADAIKAVKATDEQTYLSIRKQVIEMTSITQCNTKQMWEYMQSVKTHGEVEIGVTLRIPEDRRFGRMLSNNEQ